MRLGEEIQEMLRAQLTAAVLIGGLRTGGSVNRKT
jgi:hypothetical protein